MPKDSNLIAALKALHAEVDKLELNEAVEFVDNALSALDKPDYISHFQLCKAELLHRAGRRREAAALLQQEATKSLDIASIQYYAGEYLVELGRFADAVSTLSRCIDLEQSETDPWFLETAYLLRAFALAKLGRVDAARADLRNVRDEESLFWIDAHPPISKWSISRMLSKS